MPPRHSHPQREGFTGHPFTGSWGSFTPTSAWVVMRSHPGPAAWSAREGMCSSRDGGDSRGRVLPRHCLDREDVARWRLGGRGANAPHGARVQVGAQQKWRPRCTQRLACKRSVPAIIWCVPRCWPRIRSLNTSLSCLSCLTHGVATCGHPSPIIPPPTHPSSTPIMCEHCVYIASPASDCQTVCVHLLFMVTWMYASPCARFAAWSQGYRCDRRIARSIIHNDRAQHVGDLRCFTNVAQIARMSRNHVIRSFQLIHCWQKAALTAIPSRRRGRRPPRNTHRRVKPCVEERAL